MRDLLSMVDKVRGDLSRSPTNHTSAEIAATEVGHLTMGTIAQDCWCLIEGVPRARKERIM